MPKKGQRTVPATREKIAATLRARFEAERGPRYIEDANGCFLWQRGTRGQGAYPSQGQRQGIYQRERGVYPKGWDLHHECGIGRCVNPAHQLPLTKRQHVLLHRYLRLKGFRDLDVPNRIALSRALWEAHSTTMALQASSRTASQTASVT